MRYLNLYFLLILILISSLLTAPVIAQEEATKNCEIDIRLTPNPDSTGGGGGLDSLDPEPDDPAIPGQPQPSVTELNLTLPNPPNSSNDRGIATYKACITNNGQTDAKVELRISKLDPENGEIEGYRVSGYGSAFYDDRFGSWNKPGIEIEAGETAGLLVEIEFGVPDDYRIHWSISTSASNQSIGTDTVIAVPSVDTPTPTSTQTETLTETSQTPTETLTETNTPSTDTATPTPTDTETPNEPDEPILPLGEINVVVLITLLYGTLSLALQLSDKPYGWQHLPGATLSFFKNEKYDHDNDPLTYGIIWERVKSRFSRLRERFGGSR